MFFEATNLASEYSLLDDKGLSNLLLRMADLTHHRLVNSTIPLLEISMVAPRSWWHCRATIEALCSPVSYPLKTSTCVRNI
jgi:hypothetical protein